MYLSIYSPSFLFQKKTFFPYRTSMLPSVETDLPLAEDGTWAKKKQNIPQ
jgi:hypothetical protein